MTNPDKLTINKSVNIGRFTIIEYPPKEGCVGAVSIRCNEKSEAEGEGGTFDESELEKVIGDFYDKHF